MSRREIATLHLDKWADLVQLRPALPHASTVEISDRGDTLRQSTSQGKAPRADRRLVARSQGSNAVVAKRYNRPRCSQAYTARKSLNRHIRSQHENETFQCNICLATFNRRDIRDRHEQEQHRSQESTYSCQRCGKTISRRHAREHQNTRSCLETARAAVLYARRSNGTDSMLWLPSSTIPTSPRVTILSNIDSRVIVSRISSLIMQATTALMSNIPFHEVWSSGDTDIRDDNPIDHALHQEFFETLDAMHKFIRRSVPSDMTIARHGCMLYVGIGMLAELEYLLHGEEYAAVHINGRRAVLADTVPGTSMDPEYLHELLNGLCAKGGWVVSPLFCYYQLRMKPELLAGKS